MRSKLGNKELVVDLASKAKKGKGKQADGENAAPIPSPAPARNAARPAVELGSPAARSPRAAPKASHTSPTRPPKSPLRQTKFASPSPRSLPTRSTRPRSPQQAVQASAGSSSRPSSRAAASPAPPSRKDLSMIAESTSERSSAGNRQPIRSPTRSRPQSPLRTRPQSPRLAAQQAARSPPRSPARKEAAPQPSIEAVLRPAVTVAPPLVSTAQPAPAVINAAPAPGPAPAPAPAAPIRAVRSSWLSKALGSGAVPTASHADTTATFRKSVVPQARPTLHNDYTGLRESLAPHHGLKRKSDQGLDEEEGATRPEKIVKVDTTPRSAPVLAPAPASRPPSVFERKISQPATITAAPTPAPVSQPDSEVAKVRNALEAIQERAAVKELAMQKVTLLAAASGDGTRKDAVAGGTSFFRGLTKSLGIGGRTESPEEEKARLAQEIEDEREAAAEAQAHLQRLLNGTTNEDASKEVVDMVTAPLPPSTTLVLSPPTQDVQSVDAHPASERTEAEEDAEEEQIVEDISIVEEEEELEVIEAIEKIEEPIVKSATPVTTAAPRLHTPPKLPSIRLSTTPTTTPPAHLAQALRSAFNPQVQTKSAVAPPQTQKAEVIQTVKSINKDEIIDIDADTEDEEDDDEDMEIGKNVAQHVKHIQNKQVQTVSRTLWMLTRR